MDSSSSKSNKRVHRACLNCRRKKVRCHGERPICSFCARLSQRCIYPEHTVGEQPLASISNLEHTCAPFLSFDIDDDAMVSECFFQGDEIEWSRLDQADMVQVPEGNYGVLPTQAKGTTAGSELVGTRTNLSIYTPNKSSQQLAIDTYFKHCHNQPYSLFHEDSFRSDFDQNLVPEYLILAIIALTLRFSHDANYKDELSRVADHFAAQSWRALLVECFESAKGPDHRTVQGTILLAIHQYVGCDHQTAWIRIGMAISIAQSLNMMREPAPTLANSTQEEHRRTLWSIFILDRMATCGVNRSSLFPDSALSLRLPCSEDAFRHGDVNNSPTLELSNDVTSDQLSNTSALTRLVLLASNLNRIATFSLQQKWESGRESSWEQNPEYARILGKLQSIGPYFDMRLPFDSSNGTLQGRQDFHEVALCMFSHVLYHLCYCIFHHPFVLTSRYQPKNTSVPNSLLSGALQASWQHAQDLTHTLSYATQRKMPIWAPFYAYCSLIAGTINSLHCFNVDENIKKMSELSVQLNLLFLEQHAKLYANSANMLIALKNFEKDSWLFQHLISPINQGLTLNEDDAKRLIGLLDYSALSNKAGSEDRVDASTRTTHSELSIFDVNNIMNVDTSHIHNWAPEIVN